MICINNAILELWSLTLNNQLTITALEKCLKNLLFVDNVNICFQKEHDGVAIFNLPEKMDSGERNTSCFPLYASFPHRKTKSGYVELKHTGPLSFHTVRLLETISPHISLILERIKTSNHFHNSIKSLTTIIHIGNTFSYEEKLEITLGNIIEKIKRAFGATTGGMMLYNQKTDTLELQKPSFGAIDKDVTAYMVSIEEPCNASRVFKTGIPLISNNCPEDDRLLQRYVSLYKVYNLMTVPLHSGKKIIGVLHIGNKKDGTWTENDLELLLMMSAHLGGLIEKAYMVEKIKENHERITNLSENRKIMIEELNHQKSVIDTQRSTLEWVLSIHNDLLQTLLLKGGIKEITMILTERIKKSVIIIDNYYQSVQVNIINQVDELVYEQYIKPKKIALNKSTQIILDKKKYHITPFQIDLKYYNLEKFYLLVIAQEQLKTHEVNVIRQTSVIFSLEVMRQKSNIETENKIKFDYLDDLIFSDNINKSSLLSRAAFFNHNLNIPNVIIMFHIDQLALLIEKEKLKEEEIVRLKTRLLTTIENRFWKYFSEQNKLIIEKGDTVFLLLPTNENCTQVLHANIKIIQQEVNDILKPLTLSVGISNPCIDTEHYKDNYLATKKAIEINENLGKNSFMVYQDQIGLNALFYDLYNQKKFRKFILDFIAPLLEYEKNKKVSLIETLESYLKDLNLQRTADSQCSHVNTVRYRLNKIEELLSIQLNSKEDRLKLDIALNIYKFHYKYK